MPKPGIPMVPDKIHIGLEDTLSNLGVGQTGQYIYPISKCCSMRADRRAETPWGSTDIYDAYYCCFCEKELELYKGHEPEFVEVERDYRSVQKHVLMVAINNWTSIPPSAFTIDIEQ